MGSEYLFCYKTVARFSSCVMRHDILLRCLPAENDCQHIVEQHLVIPPSLRIMHGIDVYGNRIQYGGMEAAHDTLTYISTGIIRCDKYNITDPCPAYIYSIPSRLTMPSEALRTLLPEKSDPVTTAQRICHVVNQSITYSPMVTTMATPATEVALTGKGVCQDMAHVMISLCRQCGIPARYVNGFVTGTGVTHAWVEIWHDGVWIPFDPTHDVSPNDGYIKIAHGRDAYDCPVCRGIFIGQACESSEVSVTVERTGLPDIKLSN